MTFLILYHYTVSCHSVTAHKHTGGIKMDREQRNGNYQSVFTGTLFGLLGVNLVTVFVTGITFGIAYPWIVCWKEAWLKEHTFICGRRLCFNGTGMQLIGSWLKWLLLSIVTFGIYSLWLPIKIEQWKVKHTCFADEARYFVSPEEDSRFGEWLSDVASTVKHYALILWNKLCVWINGKPQSSDAWENGKQQTSNTCEKEKPQASDSWVCPCCCHRNPPSSLFCVQDGMMRPGVTRCPKCGAYLDPNAKFCGRCAHPVHRD